MDYTEAYHQSLTVELHGPCSIKSAVDAILQANAGDVIDWYSTTCEDGNEEVASYVIDFPEPGERTRRIWLTAVRGLSGHVATVSGPLSTSQRLDSINREGE